jgi:hypothetical protein
MMLSPQKKQAQKPVMARKLPGPAPARKNSGRAPPIVFSPQKNREEYERVRFILKACGKAGDDKTRFKTVLHVEQAQDGSRLVATDGQRLHIAVIETRIQNGEYRPVITRDTISLGEPVNGIPFPNWARVIPEKTRKRATLDFEKTGMGKDKSETERLSRTYSVLVKKTGAMVNLRHLEDLTKTEWDVYCQAEPQKAILFKETGSKRETVAVIAPLPAA